MNLRPSGYEPDELPGCSTPRREVLRVRRWLWAICRFGARPAADVAGDFFGTTKPRRLVSGHCVGFGVRRGFVLCRPGGDLLSQVLRHSTIGADAFDGRVRDGIGSGHVARATRPAKNEAKQQWVLIVCRWLSRAQRGPTEEVGGR